MPDDGGHFDFDEQLQIGGRLERRIARSVSNEECVLPVPRRLQHRPFHMDQIWISREWPHRVRTVEITGDWRAAETGNALIEVHSVDVEGRPGKYWETWANLAVHALPSEGYGYVVKVDAIQSHMTAWSHDYREVKIPNDGYHTVGLPVPLSEIESISLRTIEFPPLEHAA